MSSTPQGTINLFLWDELLPILYCWHARAKEGQLSRACKQDCQELQMPCQTLEHHHAVAASSLWYSGTHRCIVDLTSIPMCATCRRHIDDAPWCCFAVILHLCLCCVSHIGGGSLYEPKGRCQMYSKHCFPLIRRHFVYDSVPCVPYATKGASFATRLSMLSGMYIPTHHSRWLTRERHGFGSPAIAMQS